MNSPGADLGPDSLARAAGHSTGAASGGYVIDASVHTGRMADLFRVHVADGYPDPGFALVMKLAHARVDHGRADFVHSEVEHQLLPLLNSPHVPRFVASIDLGRAPRLVREWVEGTLVQEWLDAPQRPAIDEVLRLGMALARAVHSLHRQHVVHHDLQPAHVVIRPDGSVVLLGFGQARHAQLPDLLAAAVPSRRAGARALERGAAAWVAPEQLLGVRGDARSDLFAIGVMLYQLLGGSPPFGAPQSIFGLYRRLWQAPRPLQQLNPAVTPWLQEVVQRCLAPDSAQRYPTAAHLLFDLLHPQVVPPAATGLAGWLHKLKSRSQGGLRALGLLDEWVPASAVDGWPAPIVMLVVTPSMLGEPPRERLSLALQRALGTHPYARLLCAMVMAPGAAALPGDPDARQERDTEKPAPPRAVAMAAPECEATGETRMTTGVPAPFSDGMSRHGLARLRLWARPLGQPGRTVACRVLVDADAVQALLACAGEHCVDEIVLLAPPAAGLTAAQLPPMTTGAMKEVTAEMAAQLARSATCTVQVVRP